MDLQARYDNAVTLLTAASTAYARALATPQHVRTGSRQKNDYDLAQLGAEVTRWQKEVDKLESLLNGGVRPHINGPLRVFL